jgi:hypothetical protein
VCGNFEKTSDVETFAAVVNTTMVKLFFMIVAIMDWECYQFDFERGFLNGKMDARLVFVRQPSGFGNVTNQAYKLLKTPYGLRDSSLVTIEKIKELQFQSGITKIPVLRTRVKRKCIVLETSGESLYPTSLLHSAFWSGRDYSRLSIRFFEPTHDFISYTQKSKVLVKMAQGLKGCVYRWEGIHFYGRNFNNRFCSRRNVILIIGQAI